MKKLLIAFLSTSLIMSVNAGKGGSFGMGLAGGLIGGSIANATTAPRTVVVERESDSYSSTSNRKLKRKIDELEVEIDELNKENKDLRSEIKDLKKELSRK